jgi:dimethylargininase
LLVAITRAVSPAIVRCELTHVARQPIDVGLAEAQHAEYERRLGELGCRVERLPAEPDLPDSVFVEDVAIVLDEAAVLTRPGAVSRRPEVPSVAEALSRYRPLARIEPPATLDGGDVLRIGRTLFVGRSTRTDSDGVEQLRRIVRPFGYDVRPVEVGRRLHLKSAVSLVGEGLVLVDPDGIDTSAFDAFERIAVDPAEPHAANALRVGEAVVQPAAYPRTRERLERRGVRVVPVDVSEILRAEGGVTCCSLVFDG